MATKQRVQVEVGSLEIGTVFEDDFGVWHTVKGTHRNRDGTLMVDAEKCYTEVAMYAGKLVHPSAPPAPDPTMYFVLWGDHDEWYVCQLADDATHATEQMLDAYPGEHIHAVMRAVPDASWVKGRYRTIDPVLRPDETRVCVNGKETPPYEGAVAYVRNTLGEYGIRFDDGATNWLGTAGKAFGEYDSITLHGSEQ